MSRRARELPVSVRASALAGTLSRELGMPPGNLWIPGIARGIARDYIDEGYCDAPDGWALIERDYRASLGMEPRPCPR